MMDNSGGIISAAKKEGYAVCSFENVFDPSDTFEGFLNQYMTFAEKGAAASVEATHTEYSA